MNLNYKIGLRSVKTVVAVLLCLITGMFFKPNSIFYSSIAAVMCMQPTTEKSWHVGIHRFLGTIIGGISGFLIVQLLDFFSINQILYLCIVPIGLLVVIYFCNVIDKQDAVSMCCIVFLSIVTNFDRGSLNTEIYVFNRIVDTFIGISWSIFVNSFLVFKES